jgi:hypothetical protein
MKHIESFISFNNQKISENLSYHLNNGFGLFESIFRIESDSWLELVNEARDLFNRGEIGLTEDEIWLIGTDVGRKGIYEGEEVLLDIPFEIEESIDEAEYRGKKVSLNRPFRTPSGPRKFGVYTKNEKGNVVKVGFGQPGMRVNNNDPAKARSFQKRMKCDQPGPKWRAKYWSCNVARYRKLLGIKSKRPW